MRTLKLEQMVKMIDQKETENIIRQSIKVVQYPDKMILSNNLLTTKQLGKMIHLPYYVILSSRFLLPKMYPLKYRLFRFGHCIFNEFARCRYIKEVRRSFIDSLLPESTTLPRPYNFPDVAFSVESLKIIKEFKSLLNQ